MSKAAARQQAPTTVADRGSDEELPARLLAIAEAGAPGGELPSAAGAFGRAAPAESLVLRRQLEDLLDGFRMAAEADPYGNPIQRLALEITRMLERGQIGLALVDGLVQLLCAEAFAVRAERLAGYLGNRDPERNDAALRDLIRRAALEKGTGDQPIKAPFTSFKRRMEAAPFGVVFTAHPTFSLAEPLLVCLAELGAGVGADGRRLDDGAVDNRLRQLLAADHRPEPSIDLALEHRLSLVAIANARSALQRVYRIVFEVAAELYPDNWRQLRPRLVTLASWVGYDLDGRSDIQWFHTFKKRLLVQIRQLEHYSASARQLIEAHARAPRDEDLRRTLELFDTRIALTLRHARDEQAAFDAIAGRDDADLVRGIAQRMYAERGERLIEVGALIDLVDRAVGLTRAADGVAALCVLRAEIANFGLSMAETHVRLNASQLHNAIRKAVGMESPPDDPTSRNTYLAAVNAMIDTVEPVTINFGSVMAERASAKRLFMIVTQMLKYIDRTNPVRFLIAECETPFTVLAALYYAKLFGIEQSIDISPLFETEAALERGHEIVEELLAQPHYVDYVRQRGRLCIQTGFSDAGRYLGQTAASVAIERLQGRVGATMAAHGLSDVELLIFNTHGESIGRGGHPASFEDRLDYVCSPHVREALAEAGIALKQEVSFQGGDGYLYYVTPAIAFTSLCRVIEHVLGPLPASEGLGDPFYAAQAHMQEFFTAVERFNAEIMDDPDYAALLGVYGPNLLYSTGSRAVRRQHDFGDDAASLHPSQIRAIPHNAILQQMGFLANTLGGLGRAIRRDPGQFRALYADSARFRRLIGMIEYARAFSSLDALKAYIDTVDPGLWLLLAAHETDRDRRIAARAVATHLERSRTHERLVRIYRKLSRDCADLDDALADLRADVVPAGHALGEAERRGNLELLHALRVALVQQLCRLAVHIPDFSAQHGTTPEALVAQILHLDVEHAVDQLERIFPRTDPTATDQGFGEPASYRSEETQSYLREHIEIFQPIDALYRLIRRISSGVIYDIGALG
ncbi:MAG: phosphoenolpyruvate carboxylase [Alphaproteobacteria bacterium]